MIPITILTGFLGAGKTTLVNQMVKQNPDIRFGFIINEFGEVGIDGQLIETGGEELIEMSNGCLCCIVRKDLQEAVEKIADSGRVDYIVIEASGLAEPSPIAQTFTMDKLSHKVQLDSVICVIDAVNYQFSQENYQIALEQLTFGDIIVLNKVDEQTQDNLDLLYKLILKVNPSAAILKNDQNLDTKILIDTGAWSVNKLSSPASSIKPESASEDEHHARHSDSQAKHTKPHHHEHDAVDEVVFVTDQLLNPAKLDEWLQTKYPKNAIRAKGFLRLQLPDNKQGTFVFQIVGAKKSIEPYTPTQANFDYTTSRLVFIGKDLNKDQILKDLTAIIG